MGDPRPASHERPHEPVVVPPPDLPEHDPACPFCPGNEEQTPPEVSASQTSRTGASASCRTCTARSSGGSRPAVGLADVPRDAGHRQPRGRDRVPPSRRSARRDVPGGGRAGRRRLAHPLSALIARPEVRAVVVFKNFGALAGTSLAHPHSQVVATPVFLPRLLRRLDVATRYFDENGVVRLRRRARRRAGGAPAHRRRVRRLHRVRALRLELAVRDVGAPHVPPGLVRRSCGRGDRRPRVLAERSRRSVARAATRTSTWWSYSAPTNGHTNEVFHWHIKIIPGSRRPPGSRSVRR